jgi:hypothetical protein
MEVSLTENTNIQHEQLVSFDEARHVLPGAPKKQTLRNWWVRGLIPHGQTYRTAKPVHLETMRIGNNRYTSVEAYDRFLRALNEGAP